MESSSETVIVVMDGPKTVVAEWRKDYTQAYIVGGAALAVVALSYRGHKKRKAVEEKEQRDSMLKNDILTTDEIIHIDEIGRKYKIDDEAVRAIIDELLEENLLEGMYSKDGKKYILMSHIIKTMKAKL